MDEQIEVLTRLVQTDIDAVFCYDQAIARVDDARVAGALRSFRADHDRHIQELSDAIRRCGGTPPENQADVSGKLLSGMTALAAATGTVSALGIMEANEIVTNRAYARALHADLPNDIWRIVAANRDDERRHLERIQQLLGEFGTLGRATRAYGAFEGQAASLWMNTLRHRPWTLFLLAGAAGVAMAALWPRRHMTMAGGYRRDAEGLAEEMAEPTTYPGYQAEPGEEVRRPLH